MTSWEEGSLKMSRPASAGSASSHRPKMVYRADSRPPAEIFVQGFQPKGGAGGDEDMLSHVKGGENLLKTGLISTSQSLRTPAAFLPADLGGDQYVDPKQPEIVYKRRKGWVYYINTSNLEMVYVPDKLGDKDEKKYGYQQEWAVKGSIPGKNIQLALSVDGYIWRYSDIKNMKQGVDPLFPPGMSPFGNKEDNAAYAFK